MKGSPTPGPSPAGRGGPAGTWGTSPGGRQGKACLSHIRKHFKFHGYTPRYLPENVYRQTLFNMKVLDMPLHQAYVDAATQLYFDQQEKGGEV